MVENPGRFVQPGMPVYVGFYVPETYHALYGRFFKEPRNILELESEYNDYLVRRLLTIRNLKGSVPVSSVRVEADAFQSYLLSKGIDSTQISDSETSKQVSQFSTTLRPTLVPVVEHVQPMTAPSGEIAAQSIITRFHPFPSTDITVYTRNLIVGISLVITSSQGAIIGRYFIWIDGDHSIKDCLKVLTDLVNHIPGTRVRMTKKVKPLHLCSCCRLPLAVCLSRTSTMRRR